MFSQKDLHCPIDSKASHLCDVGTWTSKEAIVTQSERRAGDHRHIAAKSDDSGIARETRGAGKHGNIVPHADNRKRIDSDRGPDGKERIHRKTEGIKLQGLNQYPTIVGIVNNQPFKYLGVINSTLALNRSLKKSNFGLDLNQLQQLGLRLSSSCDTQCHGTPFSIFNSATREYEPYVNKLQHGDFKLHRADFYFSPDQQYTSAGQRVAFDG